MCAAGGCVSILARWYVWNKVDMGLLATSGTDANGRFKDA